MGCSAAALERKRMFRERHAEEIREYNRRYREANREKCREAGRRWRAANPERQRQHEANWRARNRKPERERSKKVYAAKRTSTRLSKWYRDAALAQDSRCAGCGMRSEKLVIDHDHETGKLRGLLCNPCNLALGLVKDRPATLLALTRYLKKHKGN